MPTPAPRVPWLRAILPWLFVCAVSCAGAGEGPAPAEKAFDPDAERAREVDALPMAEASSPDGRFRVRVPGVPAPIDVPPDATFYAFDIGLGTRSSVQCFVYPEGLHLAASLIAMSDAALQAGPDLDLEAREIGGILAGVASGHAYMGVRWNYLATVDGSRLLGEYTIYAATKHDLGVICVQDELGFEMSFFRIFEAFVGSLEMGGVVWPEAYYVEAMTMYIGGRLAGITRAAFTMDDDGDTEIETTTAVLAPTAADTLSGDDSLEIQFSTAGGDLINEYTISIQSGRLAKELALARGEMPGAWTVNGVIGGEDFSAEIPGSALLSTLGQTVAVRQALEQKGSGAELEFATWLPDADPGTLLSTRYSIGQKRSDGDFDFTTGVGPVSFEGVMDTEASVKLMHTNVGNVSVELRRVLKVGALSDVPGAP